VDDGAVQLEVMATSVDGVALAVGAGADRVELCQDMPAGGTTPSIGLVREALRRTSAAGVDLMVMIRPRGGHFVYSSEELDVMRADIEQVVALGVTGVVFGLLTPEGEVDRNATTRLVDAAGVRTTFHRAVDVSADVISAARAAWECGCDAVLSSGGAPSALAGAAVLAELRRWAPQPQGLIAAGGITAANVAQVLELTGVNQVHASVRTSADTSIALDMPLGPLPDWPAASWPVPDEGGVAAIRGVLGPARR